MKKIKKKMKRLSKISDHILESIETNRKCLKIFISGESSIFESFIFNMLCNGLIFGKEMDLELIVDDKNLLDDIIEADYSSVKKIHLGEMENSQISLIFKKSLSEEHIPNSSVLLFINLSENGTSFFSQNKTTIHFQENFSEEKPILESIRISNLLRKFIFESFHEENQEQISSQF